MSSAVAVKAAKTPPSSFSKLLRRSRFATYDPQIGQIYTTYDGSAHRGDWGIKRPLAVRRRDGRLAISSIDTLYQQTEWTSAYSDTVTVRKFEEMGVTPALEPQGSWGPRLGVNAKIHQGSDWLFDSDYTDTPPSKVEKALEVTAPVPDFRSMSPKRLERFLRRVRRLQPEFQEFLEKEEERKLQSIANDALERGKSPSTLRRLPPQEMVKIDARDYLRFLGEKFAQKYKAEDSTVIRPMPHPTAGLTYVKSNELQTAIGRKLVPGRRLRYLDVEAKMSVMSVNVAVGGWTAIESVKRIDELKMTDWGMKDGEPRKDVDAGKALFKPTACTLVDPPEVVRRYPERLDAATIKVSVMSWDDQLDPRANLHTPGTPEYITHREVAVAAKEKGRSPSALANSRFTMTGKQAVRTQKRPLADHKEQAAGLLNRLRLMTPRNLTEKKDDDDLL